MTWAAHNEETMHHCRDNIPAYRCTPEWKVQRLKEGRKKDPYSQRLSNVLNDCGKAHISKAPASKQVAPITYSAGVVLPVMSLM